MEEDELNELQNCADCDAAIDPRLDRAYVLNEDLCLCFACAVRRGGKYDALHETWTTAPDVSGEPDARRDPLLVN